METLAVHKSKRYMIMGACFPASVLIFSFITFPKRNDPTVVFTSLFHFVCAGRLARCELVCM